MAPEDAAAGQTLGTGLHEHVSSVDGGVDGSVDGGVDAGSGSFLWLLFHATMSLPTQNMSHEMLMAAIASTTSSAAGTAPHLKCVRGT